MPESRDRNKRYRKGVYSGHRITDFKLPVDEKIMKQTEIQKVKQRYQDVNKNEVEFRGKIPANIEYENNEQKIYRKN